ncbi:MAG: hypothetical protein M3Q51_00890 [Pseudomonadota bacterium]|nr:hypothetical protein [Pseudomonadota bacterium]MDQ3159560.1 hypothetical protein [Pseudomonadota bacterium]
MGTNGDEAGKVPTASPDPACNTGYAEPKPCTKEQAQIPGAKKAPDAEEGGLEHAPDPTT